MPLTTGCGEKNLIKVFGLSTQLYFNEARSKADCMAIALHTSYLSYPLSNNLSSSVTISCREYFACSPVTLKRVKCPNATSLKN
jgi:hypothetical protein